MLYYLVEEQIQVFLLDKQWYVYIYAPTDHDQLRYAKYNICRMTSKWTIDRMKEVIANLKVGDPMQEDTDMGPMININAAKRIEEQVNQMVSEGATIVCGGKREDAYYYPTILDNVTKDMEVAKDMEIFGPVISVIGFDTEEEAIEIANQSSYGLCGNVITKDYAKGIRIAHKLECGGAVVNGASFYRSFEMPFGGWKHSGIGNEGVMTTLQEMSRLKTIVLKNIL